jgi:hypothetical protein
MRSIDAEWRSYEKAVVPKTAGEVQRQETRRAFYAGASAMLNMQMEMAELSEDAAVAVLNGLHEEAGSFAFMVMEGKA